MRHTRPVIFQMCVSSTIHLQVTPLSECPCTEQEKQNGFEGGFGAQSPGSNRRALRGNLGLLRAQSGKHWSETMLLLWTRNGVPGKKPSWPVISSPSPAWQVVHTDPRTRKGYSKSAVTFSNREPFGLPSALSFLIHTEWGPHWGVTTYRSSSTACKAPQKDTLTSPPALISSSKPPGVHTPSLCYEFCG